MMKSAGHSILALLLALLTPAHGTSEYDYKPGELLVIKDGKSPDKKLSIVSGDPDKKGGFGGIYLTDAQTKKVLGALEAVSTELDTGPDAYVAHWSPDSKHVSISSRGARHMLGYALYRIENQRAYLVETPNLMCHAVPDFCHLVDELTEQNLKEISTYSDIVKWVSPARFLVRQISQFQIKTRDPSSALGRYGEIEKEDSESDQASSSYHVWFRAEGECELLPGDKSQVVNTRPVKKQDNKK
jgi:hypothetical protein